MNSTLYKAKVMHHRFFPKKHRFNYNVFYFYVDLDELDDLSKKHWLISRNKWNLFSFRDSEHLQLPLENPDKSRNVKEQILQFLTENNSKESIGKIMLLTGFNVLGYNFNPVSFYYVYSISGELVNVLVEVTNTYKEMKPYLLGKEHFNGRTFEQRRTKYFYVSPFISHDADFHFKIAEPNESVVIGIDDYENNQRNFTSNLIGTKKKLTSLRLFWYSLRFPLIPVKIITLIHWQAFKLYLKKIKFYKKSEFQNLQRDVYRKKK
jgi:DUF1365 family protein